jgi:small-conductance mechanosensitive channel
MEDTVPQLAKVETYRHALQLVLAWLQANVWSLSSLVQVAAVGAAFAAAWFLAPRLERRLGQISLPRLHEGRALELLQSYRALLLPGTWLLLLWLIEWIAVYSDWPSQVLRLVVSLLAAWVVIRLTSGFVRDPFWARVIASAAWVVAALNILGLLGATMAFLNAIGFGVAGMRISALTVIRGAASLAILLWLAVAVSQLVEKRIVRLPHLTPSLGVLLAKLAKVVLITIAVVVALGSVGIDLTAFTVFSGAIGLGIGFGLQKTVSNLISGVIILLDRSIKPGDVIALGDSYGWIKSLSARYVSVITRDGTEHLIPNEELVTQRVENWSYSSNLVRLKIPVGIAYSADVRLAMTVIVEAARKTARVLPAPEPACILKGFGSSSVDLELRFWIADPRNGVSNVKSDILLGIWDGFHQNGIEIPFAQQDLHLRSPSRLRVVVERDQRLAAE